MTSFSTAAAGFESTFRQHYSRIYRLVMRVTGDPSTAEELAVDVFLKLLQSPPTNQQDQIGGWLSRAAIWSALEQIRKQSRQADKERNAFIGSVAGSNPHAALESKEEQTRVRYVLRKLPVDQAEILLLRHEGYTYAEIAGIQGRNAASIGTLLARAESAFRKEYVRAYGEPNI